MGFPVDVEGVIGVDALESTHAARGLIDAPGQDIFTLTPADHYDAASGSSLAAAEVSAVVALLRARDSRVVAERVRTLLEASARPVSTSSGMRDVINACEAMTSLARNVRCQSPEMPAFAEGPRFRR
jgi:subtilisin family serine protease